MSLVQLMYISSAVNELSDDQLDEILKSCIRHNAAAEITGMLLYTEGNFMQLLEGSEAAIEETYQRICNDSRHNNFFLISKGAISQRDFSAWSMGFRRLTKGDAKSRPTYAPLFENGFNLEKLGAQSKLAADMMREFSYLNADQNSSPPSN